MDPGDSIFEGLEKSRHDAIVLIVEDSIVPLIPDRNQGFPNIECPEVWDSKSSERLLQDYSILFAVPDIVQEGQERRGPNVSKPQHSNPANELFML